MHAFDCFLMVGQVERLVLYLHWANKSESVSMFIRCITQATGIAATNFALID